MSVEGSISKKVLPLVQRGNEIEIADKRGS